jgi:hypothetical protein
MRQYGGRCESRRLLYSRSGCVDQQRLLIASRRGYAAEAREHTQRPLLPFPSHHHLRELLSKCDERLRWVGAR